jgi:hypothetical protein
VEPRMVLAIGGNSLLFATLEIKDILRVGLSVAAGLALVLQANRLVAEELIANAFRDGPYASLSLGPQELRVWGTTLKADETYGSNAADEAANVRSSDTQVHLSVGYEANRGDARVLGFEASISSFAGQHINYDLRNDSSIAATVAYDQGPVLSVRRKIGIVTGQMMLFGTFGPALLWEKQTRTQYVQDGNNTATTVTSFAETDSKIRFGAAMSVGVRRAISRDWSMSFELHHVLLVPQTFHFADARGGVLTGNNGGYHSVQGRSAESAFRNTALLIGLTQKF